MASRWAESASRSEPSASGSTTRTTGRKHTPNKRTTLGCCTRASTRTWAACAGAWGMCVQMHMRMRMRAGVCVQMHACASMCIHVLQFAMCIHMHVQALAPPVAPTVPSCRWGALAAASRPHAPPSSGRGRRRPGRLRMYMWTCVHVHVHMHSLPAAQLACLEVRLCVHACIHVHMPPCAQVLATTCAHTHTHTCRREQLAHLEVVRLELKATEELKCALRRERWRGGQRLEGQRRGRWRQSGGREGRGGSAGRRLIVRRAWGSLAR